MTPVLTHSFSHDPLGRVGGAACGSSAYPSGSFHHPNGYLLTPSVGAAETLWASPKKQAQFPNDSAVCCMAVLMLWAS